MRDGANLVIGKFWVPGFLCMVAHQSERDVAVVVLQSRAHRIGRRASRWPYPASRVTGCPPSLCKRCVAPSELPPGFAFSLGCSSAMRSEYSMSILVRSGQTYAKRSKNMQKKREAPKNVQKGRLSKNLQKWAQKGARRALKGRCTRDLPSLICELKYESH